jgi:hypothetical protein
VVPELPRNAAPVGAKLSSTLTAAALDSGTAAPPIIPAASNIDTSAFFVHMFIPPSKL